MLTRKQLVAQMKKDKCNTQSRSRNGNKFHNKYTELLGKLGYKGINKQGIHTKLFSYGAVGHCCEGAQYHLIKGGYKRLVPKSKGYIWNTNKFAAWLKPEPNIKNLGKVEWYNNDFSYAEPGDIVFKGSKGKSNYTHTCVYVKHDDKYVWTRDWNVGGKYKGKKYNNGCLHKRKIKSYNWGIAHMPYKEEEPEYQVGKTYTVATKTLKVRTKPSTKEGKVVMVLHRSHQVKALEIKKKQNGSIWIRCWDNRWCLAKGKKLYLK